ncbi:bifunctional protein FolD 1, mitochondrial-like protein isoform X1 [Tanacetum coccineum]|uniref:Bifunctional protein FolD 1, mitochondrial-like protein isoform X1 n=1 Tax=Tanacetum coccineum TaxID=301880 RepID=A0ABQ4WNH2_9ASTR
MATLDFCDKHNMVAYLEKTEGSAEFYLIIDFLTASHIYYALTENPTIYATFIKQFWTTATASTNVNKEVELTASIDGQAKTITEASLRRHQKLEDNGGITSLPNTEIFEQLALMGNMKRVTRGYSGKDVPLFPSMTTAPETSPSRITSSPSLSPQHTSASAPSTSPSPITETTPTAEEPAPMPHESPLQSVQSLGRDESSVSLNELMDLVTQLTNKVGSLENELKNTKKAYGTAITKLVKRVKKLEKQVKTGKASRRTKIVLLEDEAVKEDSSKQGRSLIEKLDMDVDISLVPPHAEIQEKISDETEVLLLYEIKEVVKRGNKRFLLLTLHLILLIYQLVLPVKLLRSPRSKCKKKGLVMKKPLDYKNRLMRKKEKGLQEMLKLIARDAEIAKQLQEEYDKAEVDTAHVIDWNDPSVIRYHALQNRPRSEAEVRKNMMVYLKNQGGYKMKDFKGMSYDDIRPIFEKVWDQIHSFVPMDSEEEVQRLKRAGQDVEAKPAKRQRTEEVSEDDLVKLWSLVQERYNSSGLTEDKEIELWVELKMLFEPNAENLLELQKYMHDPLKWWLYDMCAVHHVSTEKGQDIFMLVEKDYPLTKGLATLMLSNKLRVDQQSEMADELLIKIYNIANRPRKGGLLGFRASTLSTADNQKRPAPQSPSSTMSSHHLNPPLAPHNNHRATEIDGKLIANDIKATLATEISNLKSSIGKVPGLGVVLVGTRKDSLSFVRIKKKACEQVGIDPLVVELPEDCAESEVLDAVSALNYRDSVHGILVQLPLPSHMNEEKIINAVNVEKDVDGFHPINMGNLAMTGRSPLFIPCASRGCIEVLHRYGVEIIGKKAVVIGRSKITGLPTSLLLERHHATVCVVHAFTKNPEEITSEADILVSDVGIPNLVRGHWLKPGVVVIDMGSTLVKDSNSSHGSRVTGDVCYEEAMLKASAITPVPGGIGPVTISMLLSNTVEAAKHIMFVVCAYSRFQVTPKTSHLHAVKRIFRYLKGKPKLGLWYPRESSFDLVAYSDSDYGGANLDRKSTTGGCQFLSHRLVSWQCKKQTIVATSTTKAEYVAAANCCGQVLWIQNQMLDYGFNFMNTRIYIDNESTICIVKNLVFHSKTKHIEIRHHFIRDAYEKKLIQVLKIHTDDNVADLLTKAFDVSRRGNCWKHGCSLSVGFYHHTTNGHQFTMSNKHQELASPKQTASALAIPGQTATGKELSNSLMAGSLPKTTLPPKLLE